MNGKYQGRKFIERSNETTTGWLTWWFSEQTKIGDFLPNFLLSRLAPAFSGESPGQITPCINVYFLSNLEF